MIDITIIPVLKDNYAYFLQGNGETAVIDPGESAPVIAFLEKNSLSLDYILNTHHHGDHIAGNSDLVEKYGAKLVGPAKEKTRIPHMDIMLSEGNLFKFGGEKIQILETSGHTLGHICFYLPQTGAVFTGDTLFLMSCGRLFEGTAEQMWNSLQKIAALPDETKIYCGHEYTLANSKFCLRIEPENEDLKKRAIEVKNLRRKNLPTIPATIGLEKKTNIFLRAGSADNFATLRALRDQS